MQTNQIVSLQDGKSWWLRLKPGDLAKKVVLAIELDMPKKCILPLLANVEKISQFGEYEVYNGTYQGEKISIVYHGSGSFSVSTAIEEIAVLGAAAVLRIGSCGALSAEVSVGDVIVCDGTIREDRIMLDYVPAEYPAIADRQIVENEIRFGQEEQLVIREGITLSTATLYPASGYETAVGILDSTPYDRIRLWEKVNTLAVDVETSTVLIMARLFHMKGGSLLGVSNHCITGEGGSLTDETVKGIGKTGLAALHNI